MVVTFALDGDAYIYWADGAPQDRSFGFLPTILAVASATLPTVDLDSGGTYFSLNGSIPAGASAEIETMLRTLLAQHERHHVLWRMIWVDLDATGLAAERMSGIGLARCDPGGVLAVAFSVDMAGYVLDVPPGATLGIDPAGAALMIQGAAALAVSGPRLELYPAAQGLIDIPASGQDAGSLRFAIDLPNGGAERNDFARLDVGIRFGWRDGAVGVDYHQLSVLAQPVATPISLFATIAPFALLDPAVTRFSFVSPTGPTPSLLSTYFSPVQGQLTLVPTTIDGHRAGGLVFAVQPLMYGEVGTVPVRYYLTPDGSFGVQKPWAAPLQIACGMAALEWLRPDIPPMTIAFTPGDAFHDPGRLKGVPGFALSALATTAYVDTAVSSTSHYFAQADGSPLFGGNTEGTQYLPFLELPLAMLEPGRAAVPMLGLAGLDPATAALDVWLETTIVAPSRKGLIDMFGATPIGQSPVAEAISPLGVEATFGPNIADPWAYAGLASFAGGAAPDVGLFGADRIFQSAVLSGRPFMLLTNAVEVLDHATVHYALTQPQLDALNSDLPSCIPAGSLTGVPVGQTYDSTHAFVQALPIALQANEAAVDVLLRLAGQMQIAVGDWHFQLSPKNWPPMPAAERNRTNAKTVRTVMLFKGDRKQTVTEWLDQPKSWAWQTAAETGDPGQDVAAVVRAAIALAQARYDAAPDPAHSPYRHLLLEVLIDPNWAGLLFFNVDMPVDQLPGDLAPLAAGMNLGNFYAHHLGFDAAKVEVDKGVLNFLPGSAFGAIDYEDPTDLIASDADYGFKTLQMTVGFAQSKVSSFAGQVELLIDRLFDAQARRYPTDRGNNIVLKGVRTQHITDTGQVQDVYRFTSTDVAVYQLGGSALQAVTVRAAAMTVNHALSTPASEVVDFQLNGDFQFWAPGRQPPGSGAPPGGFDLFSYGPIPQAAAPAPASRTGSGWAAKAAQWLDTPHGRGRVVGYSQPGSDERRARVEARAAAASRKLRASAAEADSDPAPVPVASALAFEKLVIRMTFDPQNESKPEFELIVDEVALDPVSSTPRPDGLASRFPAVPARFVRMLGVDDPDGDPAGQLPADLGYIDADCGLSQAKLTLPWFGIEYELSLGTLGALSGNAEIVLHILAAWNVDPSGALDPPIYLGVKLPGSGATGFQLPLQGIMQLGFRAIQFDTYDLANPDGSSGLGYLLRLRDFALRVFGKSFPSGHIDVLLVGNPKQGQPAKLGWFASYNADSDPKAIRGQYSARRHRALLPSRSDAA